MTDAPPNPAAAGPTAGNIPSASAGAPTAAGAPPATPAAAQPVLAALWTVGAMINFTVMIVLIRYLSDTLNAFDIAFYRSVVSIALLLPFLFRGGVARGLRGLKTKRPVLMLARGVITYLALTAYVYAVGHMVLVDAVALNTTIPLWAVLFAALILGERVGPLRWLVTAAGFVGALVILRPGFVEVSWAAILALVSAVIYGMGSIVVKILSRSEPASLVVFYTNVAMVVCATGPAILSWNTPSWAQVPLVIGVGIAGTLAHICMSRGNVHADASFIAPFDFIRLALVTAAGYLLFDERASAFVWIGTVLVFGSTVLLTRVEMRARRPRPAA